MSWIDAMNDILEGAGLRAPKLEPEPAPEGPRWKFFNLLRPCWALVGESITRPLATAERLPCGAWTWATWGRIEEQQHGREPSATLAMLAAQAALNIE